MITNIYVIYNMNKGVKEQPKKKRSVPQKKEKKKRKEKKREILKAIRNEHMIITPNHQLVFGASRD